MLTKRQKTQWLRPIVFGLLSFVLCPLSAKPQPKATLSTEREQQFSYYWYAAKQAIQQERYADAYVQLQMCEQLKPEDGATQSFLGTMYDAMGDNERALAAYERAFRSNPHDYWKRYTAALLDQQTDAARRQALEVLQQAHRVNSRDEDLLEQLRQLYIFFSEYKQALKIQDEIDAIRGYDVYSAYNRVNTYAVWAKPKRAIQEVDRWLENEPNNIQFLLYRIELMERSGARVKDLYEVYERILRIDPNHLTVLNNYAYLLATHGGDLRKAEQMSQTTIRREPNNPVYLDTYGWIMHLQGQDQLALFYLRKALSNSSGEERYEIEKHLREANGEK